MCGLCGNFNEDSTDEFYSVSGSKLDNYADFVNSWLDPFEKRPVEDINFISAHPCSLLSTKRVSYKCGTFVMKLLSDKDTKIQNWKSYKFSGNLILYLK